MDLPRLKIGLSTDLLPVYIKDKDRYTNILLLGKSGTGKSSLMASWWEQDCFFKSAKVLIEPSGFLARDCYSIAKGRGHYCSLSTPVSINPMQSPYDPNTISDIIAEALNQVITLTTPNDKLTVKMRGILDKAIKWCLERNRRSLVHVRDFILNLKEPGIGETKDGVIQRLNFLLNDERLLPILCGNNSIEWGALIEKRETFILDCFGMSREKMIFTGNIISQGIKNYFRFQRPAQYKPLALYVDECQNFVNFNFMDILKEGRKYKLSCVLATQDFASIDEKLTKVMCNVGTLITYRVGFREAQLLANEMGKIKEDTVEYVLQGGKLVEKRTAYDSREVLKTLEKHYLAYMTPQEKGIAKAPRPPLVKKIEPKVVKIQPRSKLAWFPLEPYGVQG